MFAPDLCRSLLAILFMGTLSAAAGYGEDSPALRIDLPGLENVLRLSERVVSGAAPAGEAGFRALAGLGVRTIVSVDGMKPDVAAAGRHGMRYVHLPIGYDAVPRGRARAAGWRTPPEHPDVVPEREAVQVAEMAAEVGRAGETAERPREFRATLGRFREAATRLEEALRRTDEVAAEAAFPAGEATCADCHARWRDRGRGR